MLAHTILRLLPLLEPGTPPPFEDVLHHVVYDAVENAAEIRAYDHHGDVIGVVVVYVSDDLTLHVAQEYDDGYSEATIDASGAHDTSSTLDSKILADRATMILAMLPDGDAAERNSWSKCGRWVAGTAISCATVRPLGCVAGAAQVGCTCVPMVVRQFRDLECPWNA